MTIWLHAPIHQLDEAGAYIVTAGTYGKTAYFSGRERLTLLHDSLLELAAQYGWQLQAWAVFSIHYHVVAISPDDTTNLSKFIRHLHSVTARSVNQLDGAPGRRVWFEYWDTKLTYERSYLARLKYVHLNPVRHGIVPVASLYPWCSAAWFEQRADRQFYRRVSALATDAVKVPDSYTVEPIAW